MILLILKILAGAVVAAVVAVVGLFLACDRAAEREQNGENVDL